MNRYKCKNYKSAIQFNNTTSQTVAATDIVSNPVILALGSRITDTGVALDFNSQDIQVETSGLYRISANLDILGVTAGDITYAIAVNGNILPETIRTITAVAGISEIVPTETIRELDTCCAISDYNITLVAFSDGTGAATIERVSGNVLKLA